MVDLKKVLEEHRVFIDSLIQENMNFLGEPSKLREACEYALSNKGKRFRPALVLMVAKSLGSTENLSLVALAIEYFHTASLIADDLPCMDDDAERRNQPSLHIAFDEATALMASYALISAGYSCLAKNALSLSLPGHISSLAVENVSHNTGLNGATGGQFLDIYPPNLHLSTLLDVAAKKTASLFEISFVLGWLYGRGDLERIDLVKKAAYHYGMAFQIADDMGDMEQDKFNQRSVNIATVVGFSQARDLLEKELESYRKVLHDLKIATPELLALSSLLQSDTRI